MTDCTQALPRQRSYVYTYACHEDELDLCHLELRTLLGAQPRGRYVESPLLIDPSRSPFLKLRLGVLCEAGSLEELAVRVAALSLEETTFKVVYAAAEEDDAYDEQRAIERAIGRCIRGRAEMRRPQQWYAVARLAGGRWAFGACAHAEPHWLRHQRKPQNYSTALGTRVARAAVNIAAPQPAGAVLLDPCCGMGTVLIEALSMGMESAGLDLNPLAVRGARVNLAHFGMPDVVQLGDMRTLEGRWDALILDMPYNLCSSLPDSERLEMLRSAARLAPRQVIVTTEPIEQLLPACGLRLRERCAMPKGKAGFTRQLLLCESAG